ncbi:hypothetical protein E2C01_034574 [Portunus trituberculatus]|uniref:Uncharacterized protein n=1 Tax=Portunus trituberculatus TaxID=210409 RepID=A0A5B7F933_PORTR|nr:hypothetical protein [Portunus trituberculatus]
MESFSWKFIINANFSPCWILLRWGPRTATPRGSLRHPSAVKECKGCSRDCRGRAKETVEGTTACKQDKKTEEKTAKGCLKYKIKSMKDEEKNCKEFFWPVVQVIPTCKSPAPFSRPSYNHG